MGKCKKCKGPTKGYKCDICGAVAKRHDPKHGCGGRHCMPMCAKCKQAEVECKCGPKSRGKKG